MKKSISLVISAFLLCCFVFYGCSDAITGGNAFLTGVSNIEGDGTTNQAYEQDGFYAAYAKDRAVIEGRTIKFNEGWKFYLGDNPGASDHVFDDSDWQNVTIPHDYSQEQEYTSSGEAESGYLPGGIGWYRKYFEIEPNWKTSKKVVINFDGVYMNAEVYLNGVKLGYHPFGYTAFSFELPSNLLVEGENVIAVKTDNKVPSSRWYSGSGIYRDVNLIITDPVHIKQNGVAVLTPVNEGSNTMGEIDLHIKLTNDRKDAMDVDIITSVLEKGSKTVINSKKITKSLPQGEHTLKATSDGDASDLRLNVSNPKLWYVWDQQEGGQSLYTVRTEVKQGNVLIDRYETDFGFRYFKFDYETGFWFNGKNLKLKGVCMHHDQGALGSEAWYRAMERQVQVLKDMGCNAIRITHNPGARAFIDICNKEGMLVIEEAFDTFSNPKNGNTNDFSSLFKDRISGDNTIENGKKDMLWAEFSVKAMADRDKNDPSVIMWSLGNEIFEGIGGNTSDYPTHAENLTNWIIEVDSTVGERKKDREVTLTKDPGKYRAARYITIGDNRRQTSGSGYPYLTMKKIHDMGGIVGFNYADEGAITNAYNAGWCIYGSETASSVNSRGVYDTLGTGNFSAPQTQDQFLTSYDHSKVNWGALASEAWLRTVKWDYNAGEFVWTGFDYLGEPTPWNKISAGSTVGDFEKAPKSSYFGIIDTTGFPKDSYYLYQSLWHEGKNTLHILPTWDEDDVYKWDSAKTKVQVTVYTDAPVVRLYLNGKEIGAAKAETVKSNGSLYEYKKYVATPLSNGQGTNTFSERTDSRMLYANFDVTYESGVLEAKAFDENGRQITNTDGRNIVKTTKKQEGVRLSVTADRDKIKADGKDLCYITIDAQDFDGNFVNSFEGDVTVTVTGEGTLLALDNGRQNDHTPYTNSTRKATRGKLLAIVQSTKKDGKFTVTAVSDKAKEGTVTVLTVAE